MFSNIRRFKEFYLEEGRKSLSEGTFSLFEDASQAAGKEDKVGSYRNIAYMLAEIFGLYGFFFGQKENFFDEKNWPKLMDQIIRIKDHDARWATIVKMSKFLQERVKSIKTEETTFGYRGQYDFGTETEDLPKATEFLKAASSASFKSFTEEEKKKALEIMDGILKNMKPVKMSASSPVKEAMKYVPPTDVDLLRMADSSGNKLKTMYDMLSGLKTAYPKSATEIDTFINGTIIPYVDKVRNFIEVEIPKVSGPAAEGFLKKLQSFDKTVDSLIPKVEALRSKIVNAYQPLAAAKEFEDSAMAIISRVRQGIMKQAEMNARRVKAGDVVAGTTDISDPKYSGDLQVTKDAKRAEKIKELKKRGVEDLADFLANKYSVK